jgi:hypothetical protein
MSCKVSTDNMLPEDRAEQRRTSRGKRVSFSLVHLYVEISVQALIAPDILSQRRCEGVLSRVENGRGFIDSISELRVSHDILKKDRPMFSKNDLVLA